MKSISKIKFLSIVLLLALLTAATSVSEEIDNSELLVAQNASSFDRLMRQGYAAAGRRNYTRARSYFRQALRYRPGNRYATRAIANMNRYLSRRNRSRIAYARRRTGRRVAGGTRGGCFKSEQARESIIPLIPSDADGVTTTAEFPVSYFTFPNSLKLNHWN